MTDILLTHAPILWDLSTPRERVLLGLMLVAFGIGYSSI